jgi:hypothetical protein
MPVQFTESITGYVGASGISGDSSVILAGEMFAQSTFTPSILFGHVMMTLVL